MKITDIKAYPIKMPYVKRDIPMSTRPFRVLTMVKVFTDEGITGIGEAFGGDTTVAKCIEGTLKPALIGKNPMTVGGLFDETYRTFYNSGRLGITICALSGIEIALWDITGKALKTPVYQLLGGLAHDKIRAYASLPHYTGPDEVKAAVGVVLKKGYTALKLHAVDVPSVAIAREVAGDTFDIMLDVNCQWHAVDAVRAGHQFEPYNLFWYEEPVWPVDDYDGLADVRSALEMPIAAGENEYTARGFLNLIEKRAVDYLQPSVFKVGGILQQKKVFTLGSTLARRVVPHSWTFGPALAATLHVSFSETIAEFVETAIEVPETGIYTKPIIMPDKGYWRPPEGPGLGIELDDKVIAKYGI
jgi:L-alanine-DL-glutamate epimerase-like enolase superfamily enzyme